MTPEEIGHYKHFIKRLLYLPSAVEIQTAVRTMIGLQPDKLRAVFDDIGESLLKEGQSEEHELLTYVRELLNPYLAQTTVENSATIDNVQTLLKLALEQPSALRMRTLLVRNRSLLSEQVMTDLQLEASNPHQSPSVGEQWIKLFCAAALVINDEALRVRAYLFWATLLRRRGYIKKSERSLLRGMRLAERLGDAKLKTMVQGAQIGLYRAMRDLDKALIAMEQMLQAATESGDSVTATSVRMGIAQCCQDLGQYPKALDNLNLLISSLDSMQFKQTGEVLEALQLRLLKALEMRGLVQEHMGRYDQGLLDYQRSLQLARSMGDRASQFVAMNNMAASFMKRGLRRESYRRFTEILRTVTAWGNPAMIASTHNNLGIVLLDMNRPAEAIAEFQQALLFKINSADKWGEATALLGIGDAELKLGNPDKAEKFYTVASMSGLETRDVGIITMYASRMSRVENGDEDDRIKILQWALDLAKADRSKLYELVLTKHLSDLYAKRDEKQRAIDLYRSAIEHGQGYLRSSPEFLATIIGYALLLTERPESRKEAFELLTEVLEEIKIELREVVHDERRAEIIAKAIKLYGALFSLLLDQEDKSFLPADTSAYVFAFDLHESAKSRSFISDLSDSPVDPPASIPRELKKRESNLLRLERSYQKVKPEEVKSEVYRAERLKELREDLQKCWREMEPFAPQYVRFRSGEPYTFKEIYSILSEQLGERIAFVSYFCDESSTTAYVLRHGQQEPLVYRSSLGREELERTVRRLRRAFSGAPEEFPPYPPIVRDRPTRRSLDFIERLSGPLLQFLPEVEDAELLCIAPHGPLHLIPFHALRTPDGDYLASRHGVVYSPSLSTTAQLLTSAAGIRQGIPSTFVAGVSSAEDAHPEFFEQDAEIFDRRTFDVTFRVGVLDASRAHVLDALPQYDIIHLSCHGYFEEKNALNSGLLLSDGKRKPPRDPWSVSVVERHGFLLTVRDLLQVRLRANLVALNACSTGLQGQRNAGDELEGFSRALLLSGASSVMLTLWNVDQESSRHFLESFYRNWIGSDRPVEKWRALQLAQREFLASDVEYLRHPYHWAPFTLAGDWR